MTVHQMRRLIRLHEKASLHSNEYKRLSVEQSLGAQSEAIGHLRKAERIYSQVADQTRKDRTPAVADL